MGEQRPDRDAELMLAFARGDEEAFVTLYRTYRDRMVNYARRMLGNAAHGEEAAQDVFLKLYKSRERYQPTSRFSTFLYRIATNHCLNIRARHDTKRSRPDDQMDQHPDTAAVAGEGAVDRDETRNAILRALGTLPERQSAAFLLCHYEGMSYREAAGVLEMSESAIKSLIHRARSALARELQPLLRSPEEVGHAM